MGQVIHVDFGARRKPSLTAERLIDLALLIDEQPEHLLEVRRLYELALELEPNNATALNNLGNVYVRLANIDAAANCYTKAVRADPKCSESHYNLGWMHLEQGRYHQAVECLEAAVKLDRDFADAHYNLALSYSKLGVKLRANWHFRRYLKLCPEGPWAEMAKRNIR